jgi:hypothetical protein
MILDVIIALFEPLFTGLLTLLAGIFNLIAAGLEFLIALAVPAFRIKRLGRKERIEGEQVRESSRFVPIAGALVVAGLTAAAACLPMLMKRTITLVAKDGHSLPYAALILHASDGDEHLRSDNAGNFKAPRFGLKGITIKDPRYVEQTWRGDAITRQLVVSRTVLGTSLDRWAGKLMKPADLESK